MFVNETWRDTQMIDITANEFERCRFLRRNLYDKCIFEIYLEYCMDDLSSTTYRAPFNCMPFIVIRFYWEFAILSCTFTTNFWFLDERTIRIRKPLSSLFIFAPNYALLCTTTTSYRTLQYFELEKISSEKILSEKFDISRF